MIRIVSAYFVAGVVLDATAHVVRAAPILRYMLGWHASQVHAYAKRKQWQTKQW